MPNLFLVRTDMKSAFILVTAGYNKWQYDIYHSMHGVPANNNAGMKHVFSS